MRIKLRQLLIALGLASLSWASGCGSNGESFIPAGSAADDGVSAFLSRLESTGTGVEERSLALGRYMVFHTEARLTPEDINQVADVYLHDFRLGKTTLVSINREFASGNGASTRARITGDGRYVVFQSIASDLIEGDDNGLEDIFVRDLFQQTVTRISVGPAGVQANGPSHSASISDDGRFVVFCSTAENLAEGDGNDKQDVFLRDTASGSTSLVSTGEDARTSDGPSFEPTLTPDGASLVFSTEAPAIGGSAVRQIVRQQRDGSGRLVVTKGSDGSPSNEPCYNPSISDDGNLIAFATKGGNLGVQRNGRLQVYLYNLQQSTLSLLSLSPNGDLGNGHSGIPRISGDGSVVVFSSLAGNLVAQDDNGLIDIFSVPVDGRSIRLLSRGQDGKAGDADSDLAVVSREGSLVAFRSGAANLVTAAPTDREEVFLRSEVGQRTVRVSSTFEPSALWPGLGEPQLTRTETQSFSRPISLALADFNGDTILDFVSGSNTISDLHRKDGVGNGQFVEGQPMSSTISGIALFLLAEDFFRGSPVPQAFAGAIDIWASYSPVPALIGSLLFPNLGLGEFGEPLLTVPMRGLFFGATDDFNRDGRPDIAAIQNLDDPSGLLLFGADINVALSDEFDSGNSGIATGDLNRDGTPDVVTSDANSGEIVVALVESSLGTSPAFTTSRFMAGTGARSPVVSDFNRDGRLDVACLTTGGLTVLNGRPDGSLAPSVIVSDTQGGPLAGGDLNRDGKVDLVTVNANNVLVLLGRGDGTFESARSFPSIPTFQLPPVVHLADLEPDGDLDVITLTDGAGQSNFSGVTVLLNQAR